MSGGDAGDRFVFESGGDYDVIRDFERIDRLDLRSFGLASAQDVVDLARQRGADVLIDLGNDSVALENFSLGDLFASSILV